MGQQSKIFYAIIIAGAIIGVCIYFGLQNNNNNTTQKINSTFSPRGENVTISEQQNNKAPSNEGDAAVLTSLCGTSNDVIVTKVIDGDTVVVEGGYHVRLLGMDADEKGYPCYDSAKTRLENLVLSKNVLLERDMSDADQYGRCLRYIFVGNTNINAQLVKEGLAVARFYQPDVKYKTEITSAEIYAQQNKIGCKWSGAQQTAE